MTTSSLPPRKDRIAKEKKEKKAQTVLTVKQTLQEKKPTLDSFVQTEKLKEVSHSLFSKVKGLVRRNKKQKEEVTHAHNETSAARPLQVEEEVVFQMETPKEVQVTEVVETPQARIIPLPVEPKVETKVVEETEVQVAEVVEAVEANEPNSRQERKKNTFTFKLYHGVLFVFLGGLLCYWWILS